MRTQLLSIDGRGYTARVYHYQRDCVMRVTGSGFGDAEPPVHEEIEFDLFDDKMQQVDCTLLLEIAEEKLLAAYRK